MANWDAFWPALGLLVVATPVMFGTLALFAGLTALLARLTPPPGDKADPKIY